MTDLEYLINELVISNRILAREDVVDAYGHVSVRHPGNPGRFLISRSLAPELVEHSDIMELNLEGEPVNDSRSPYKERFIHSAIYEMRPDVNAIVHAHAEDTLPFGITGTPMRAVIHSGSFVGTSVPLWDIADKFGDTDLLVGNTAQGRDLARSLENNALVLMRGHGFVAVAASLVEVVRTSVNVPRNARVQLAAMQLGKIRPLTEGEIKARAATYRPYSEQMWRAWEYWAKRAGCPQMLIRWPSLDKKKSDNS